MADLIIDSHVKSAPFAICRDSTLVPSLVSRKRGRPIDSPDCSLKEQVAFLEYQARRVLQKMTTESSQRTVQAENTDDNPAKDLDVGSVARSVGEVAKPLFYDGLYAPSGFDMMSILIRVMKRPNPSIDIGAVDSNAAIILCDTLKPDSPIVYCSEGFEHLTGYRSQEVLGRNCRFLQQAPPSPQKDNGRSDNGNIGGSSAASDNTPNKRKKLCGPSPPEQSSTSNDREMLAHFKRLITSGSEAQVTITNYKKDGMRFINLLTAIPISWGSGEPMRYVVGFQADQQKCIFVP